VIKLLPSENVASKSGNAFTERKRRSQRRIRYYHANRVKTWLGKANTPLQNENVARKGKTLSPNENVALKGEKTFLPSETVTRKVENALTEPKRLTFKPITDLPSEDVPRKGENAFTERKRSTNRRNRVYGAKMSLAKAFTERKRGSLR